MARKSTASPDGRPGRRRDVLRDRGGNVALLFAFLSVPMVMIGGAAIDYGFATRLETKLQAATDATALLLCQTPLTTSEAELNALAQTTLTGAMGGGNLVVDRLAITSSPRKITLTAHKQSTTFFGGLTGTQRINPGAVSQCATPLPKTFEIALVLDNTGSMAASSGGQSKLQAVQTAATDFVNYVYTSPAFSSATKVAIVPFAAAVAVDPAAYRYASWIDQNGLSSYHWTNIIQTSPAPFKNRFDVFAKLQAANRNWGWAGCLEALPYPFNVQDGAPTTKDSFYVPLLAPDEPGDGTSGVAPFPVGASRATAYSYNSYIDDETGPACRNSSTYNTALGQACKYITPKDPASGAPLGIPNGPNFGCTTQPLQRLTSDTGALKALISKMAPSGSTNIHEGFMWGWRTLSPNSVFADGQPYASSANSSNATTINKIIILMTDGTNSWGTNSSAPTGSLYFADGYFRNANGSTPNPRLTTAYQNTTVADGNTARKALDALTAEACANTKAVNISIYTIGFSIPTDPIDSAGQTLLRNCASSPDQFYLANSSDDLIKAFKSIQASIGALRLTQ
ncbi:TadE/TadG family type IV pilus assembly protein [Methylobacterium sp. C33D]|uniref:TadE/TadG family type IV pilus assembly protein n=1 Tax=Methylobacterium mesophilicum TaxID=39956 RepID=UPI002F2D2E5A